MNILGISLGHDSSFALISEGRIIEVMEAERYFRQKRYKLHCLTLEPGKHRSGYQNVDITELRLFLSFAAKKWGKVFDYVAVQNQGRKQEFDNLLTVLKQEGFSYKQALSVGHHLAHAGSAFYTSPFSDALILSFDGFGNDGVTVFFKAGKGIKYLKKSNIRFGQSYNNLGYIIGISPDVSGSTAGKTMGLAAYGAFRKDWLPFAGKYILKYTKFPSQPFTGLNNFGKAHTINSIGLEKIPELQKFVTRVAGRNVLKLPSSDDSLSQELVQTVQHAWTEEVLNLLKPMRHVSKNLCVVGGCALNGITNYCIEQSGLFANVYFIPNPSDCGLAAGAAIYLYYKLSGKQFNGYEGYYSPYLGCEPFDLHELADLKNKFPHRPINREELPALVAKLIFEDRIVGIIKGRYEIGPRALGNRSILCNPINRNMRDILNQKVKHREWFRPFAPVVTAEEAKKYFTCNAEIPYMSVICFTQPEFRSVLPSVTHFDGSARVQTIRKEHNQFLYDILIEFKKLTGVPVLLNTSFNPRGEPILNFCRAGLEMLNTTELDLVLIEDTIFCKPGNENVLNFKFQTQENGKCDKPAACR